MRLEKVNPAEYRGFKASKNQQILDEFINSGYSMAKIVLADKEYKNAASCVSSLATSIKRFKRTNLKAALINGDAYLINQTLVNLELKEGGEENEATED